MSVYTSVSDENFSEILKSYSLGQFICSQGIEAGIENTNYFVTTTKGEYVFTLFEKISYEQLKIYISLLQELSLAGITCPQPQLDIHQRAINEIEKKPFVLVSRLKGKNLSTVNNIQCKAIAIELAKIHSASFSNIAPSNPLLQNRRGKIWREHVSKKIINKLSYDDAKLLSNELEAYQSFDDSLLPKGIIHADLFKDNVLFDDNQLSGVIDFYDACYDNYLYDIAITVNAWCINQSCADENGKLNESLTRSFLQAYQSIRPLKSSEIKAWPVMLRIAATRFWLSRLEDSLFPNSSISEPDLLTHDKNPDEYRLILQNHVKEGTPFNSLQ